MLAVDSRSLRYQPSVLDHVENLEKYQPNGFHPVHLGDKLDQDEKTKEPRYEVIHKLGSGGFSTVWLASDLINGGYVALKIVAASRSSYGVPPAVESILNSHPAKIFVTELRRFAISGPNGRHICQVLPLAGPSLLALSRPPYRLRPEMCKKLAGEAARALDFLHSRGLCHGDFTASNLALAVSPTLHQLSREDLLKILGEPVRDSVVWARDPMNTGSAPAYVVEPADLAKLDPTYLSDSLQVLDFDQVFCFETPLPPGFPPSPGFDLGTPLTSRAPEVFIDGAPGPASDIWALGCTLFRMRAGMQLFDEWHFGMPSNILADVFDVVGPPPPKWRKLQFAKNGWPVTSQSPEAAEDVKTVEFGDEPLDPCEDLQAIVYGIWDDDTERSRPEAAQFVDLLRKMFAYDVQQRITAAQILQHPWLGSGQG
ncbi:hypothetical protein VTH06DRAFT_8271 [Thermothelomyces fergusii]